MLLWIAATLAAFFVKGLCGFANTLVFTSVLSFGVSNAGISPVELLLGMPTNAILAWRERRSLDLSLCLPLAALVLLGCVPGALFLRNADTRLVRLAFGVLIVVLSVQMLAQELRPQGRFDEAIETLWQAAAPYAREHPLECAALIDAVSL